MKSTLLKTLAAASLVATTHAEIQVLGASFKERGVSAPTGTIEYNPGTVAATRGYLLLDNTVTSATPNKGTYIEYGETRAAGVVTRSYTVNSNFSAFLADAIFGDSGGRRLYGHMHAPVKVATVTNPLIPFSGNTNVDNLPRKLSFDQTTFQVTSSDSLAGPRIVGDTPSVLRSVISGSANEVNVSATTIPLATTELTTRLVRQGYTRTVGAAPTFSVDLAATLLLTDGQVKTLTVTVSSDTVPGIIPGSNPPTLETFPAPTYQWLKDNVVIPGAVGSTYTVTGGPSTATNGIGSYKVIATNAKGSTTSTTTVVSAQTLAFATQPEPAVTLVAASAATITATLTPIPGTAPTFQWQKAATSAGPFTAIAANAGGNKQALLVVGNEAATGAGVYRLDVTSTAGTIQSALSTVTINPAGTAFVFTTNSPKAVAVAFNSTAPLAPVVNATANPIVASRQWFKAPLNNPTAFVAVSAGDGGTGATLTVTGDNASPRGPGVYHVVVTSAGATPIQITSIDTTVTTAP